MVNSRASVTISHRDATTSSTLPTIWTLRSVTHASRPSSLVLAVLVATIALAAALDDHVPVTSAATIIALLPAVMVDVIDRRLPNRMVAGAGTVGLVTAMIEKAAGGTVDIGGALLGVVAFAGPLIVMHLVAPGAMGFGDVKIGVVLGAAVGLISPLFALVALCAGSFGAVVVGFVSKRRTVALGPGLLAGALLALVLTATGVSTRANTSDFAPSANETIAAT